MGEFDFKELTARAHFDYVGPSFPAWWGKNKTLLVLPSLTNIARELLLGGKYFTTLKLGYKRKEFALPNEPLISLSLTKTIVETATVGKYRKGTVKEYINTEDYQLTIRGVCVDPDAPDEYPSEQVGLLNEILAINDALDIVSNPFLELFEIGRIVIKGIDFDEMVGQQGLQKYTIRATSDQEFFAELAERDQNRNLNSVL